MGAESGRGQLHIFDTNRTSRRRCGRYQGVGGGGEHCGAGAGPLAAPAGGRVDADGNVLETFRADDDGGDGYIAEIEILRGDLSRVLYEDTRDGVEYLFGDRIVELTQDADGVEVAFAGGDRRRFGLVVGADGLHSALRAMVFGP